jgi:HSP20 family protein
MPPVIKKSTSSGAAVKRRLVLPVGWQVHIRSFAWSPPTDFFETDRDYVVRVEVAGMRQEDFSVTLDNHYLVISGNRVDKAGRRAYHQMEIRFGEFSTVLELPGQVDVDRAEASYQDGFLEVTLPKVTPGNVPIED